MTDWLPGYEQVIFNHSQGFAHRADVTKVVWHCTAGWAAEHAFNVYATGDLCPHITSEYAGTGGSGTTRYVVKRNFQHVPLDLASYSLERGDRQHPCGVETNGAGCIQIERVGFPTDDVSDEEHKWLGEAVLALILTDYPGIPHTTFEGGRRMNEQEWSGVTGQCGHRNVPCQPQMHGDPPELDLAKILQYAQAKMFPQEEDMPEYILRDAANVYHPWLFIYANAAIRWTGQGEASYIMNRYRAEHNGQDIPIVDENQLDAYVHAVQQVIPGWNP